jgi:hypothetical protein
MGFSASGAVIELAWDLRPYVDAHGVAPEPSQAKLNAYADAMAGVFGDLGLDLKPTATEAELNEAVEARFAAELEGASMVDARKKIEALNELVRKRRVAASVAVCAGKPTAKQVSDLPPRVRDAFLGWVAGWAMDPTQAGLSG